MADRKNINPRRPIPASGYDRLRTNMKSNFRDVFPTSLSGLTYSQNNTDVDYLTAEVNFKYTIYEIHTL